MKKNVKLFALISTVALCGVCAFAGVNAISTRADETPAPILMHGASVRMAEESGLRFLSSVSADYKDCEEIGTLIIPKSVLGDNELNHNSVADGVVNLDYEDIAKTKWSNNAVELLKNFDYDESRFYFNAVMLNIPESFYGTELVARAYVKVGDEYIYADEMERSIAQVSALALKDGETGVLLEKYVDEALSGQTLAMETNAYMLENKEQTLNLTGTNGYATIWTTSNADVATVDNGKVTALAKGKATITAKLGSKTVSTSVVVGEGLTGEKLVSVSEEVSAGKFVNSSNANVSNTDTATAFGSGMVKLTAAINHQATAKFTKDLSLAEYGQISFKVYVSEQEYSTYLKIFRVYNGNHLLNTVQSSEAKNGEWVDVVLDITDSELTNLKELYIRIGTTAGEPNGTCVEGYYILVSDIYASKKPVGGELLLDMEEAVKNQTFKAAGGNPNVVYSEEYGMAKIISTQNYHCAGGVYTEAISLEDYSYIQFKVFRPAGEGGYYLRILKESTRLNQEDSEIAKSAGVWYTYRLSVDDLINSNNSDTTDGKKNLWKLFIQFGSDTGNNGKTGKYIFVSDIYGIK